MKINDLSDLNVEQVIEAVTNGEISAEQALELEKQGKERKTLIEALEDMLVNEAASEKEPETKPYSIIRYIKSGTKRYEPGDTIELSPEQYEVFLKAGVIKKE